MGLLVIPKTGATVCGNLFSKFNKLDRYLDLLRFLFYNTCVSSNQRVDGLLYGRDVEVLSVFDPASGTHVPYSIGSLLDARLT